MPPSVLGRPVARVALYARSETRYLMTAIAADLKRRTGATIVLYCGTPQEVTFYRTLDRGGLFADIVDYAPGLRERIGSLPHGDALAEEARRWESRLGLTMNGLAVTNRHLGRGYALGGFGHPRSRQSENSSYEDLLRHYCASLAYWDGELRNRAFDLVINGNKELAVAARAQGVPFRVLNGARYRNYHLWGWNEFFETPEIEAAYRALGATDLAPVALDAPYTSHLDNRDRMIQLRRPLHALRRSAREIVKYAYWRWRGYAKARGYYLSENLRFFYRVWADSRRLGRLARTRLIELSRQRFVFYPLHVEPETSLQGLSPEFFYQLSLIAAVSRDLPAGALLAVKEHVTAVGRRPADFYRQIAELKNVVLLDPLELGLDCVREAAATVTICGTAGFEAALLGKPVIAFGRHNIWSFLPHVRVVTDETRLRDYLAEALDGSMPNDRTRGDGARFLEALRSVSFDLRNYSYHTLTEFDPAAVNEACTALLRSLAPTPAPATA